jgi:hypothetical protein
MDGFEPVNDYVHIRQPGGPYIPYEDLPYIPADRPKENPVCHDGSGRQHTSDKVKELSAVAIPVAALLALITLISLIPLAMVVGVVAGTAGLTLLVWGSRHAIETLNVAHFREGQIARRAKAAQRTSTHAGPTVRVQPAERVSELPPASVYPWSFPWPETAAEPVEMKETHS